MIPAVKLILLYIEDLEEKLENKKAELKKIQENSQHVWPAEWQSRVGKDYRCMSPAWDSSCRRSEPEIYEQFYKECKICGKEKVKPS